MLSLVASCTCPDWGSNPQPGCIGTMLPTNWAIWDGPQLSIWTKTRGRPPYRFLELLSEWFLPLWCSSLKILCDSLFKLQYPSPQHKNTHSLLGFPLSALPESALRPKPKVIIRLTLSSFLRESQPCINCRPMSELLCHVFVQFSSYLCRRRIPVHLNNVQKLKFLSLGSLFKCHFRSCNHSNNALHLLSCFSFLLSTHHPTLYIFTHLMYELFTFIKMCVPCKQGFCVFCSLF